MEPEVQAKRPRKSPAKPPLTPDEAKEKILAKLQKAGAKGAPSLYSSTQAKDAPAYEAALAELTAEPGPEVFVDRRAAKPKYFLWAYRPKVLSGDEAKEEILRVLQTAGAKGATALYSKAQAKDAAAFDAALADLTAEPQPEVFADRRTERVRYFLWPLRPQFPTAETVARKVIDFVRSEHPRVHSEKTLKPKLALTTGETKLLKAALEQLCATAELVPLEYVATSAVTIYVAPAQLGVAPKKLLAPPPSSPGSSEPAISPARIRAAYEELVRQSDFAAVLIAKVAAASGTALEPLKDYLREEYRAGRVVLSLGDWSIASEEERRGVIEMLGQRFLQVRWL